MAESVYKIIEIVGTSPTSWQSRGVSRPPESFVQIRGLRAPGLASPLTYLAPEVRED
jgi:hypothetical protein